MWNDPILEAVSPSHSATGAKFDNLAGTIETTETTGTKVVEQTSGSRATSLPGHRVFIYRSTRAKRMVEFIKELIRLSPTAIYSQYTVIDLTVPGFVPIEAKLRELLSELKLQNLDPADIVIVDPFREAV